MDKLEELLEAIKETGLEYYGRYYSSYRGVVVENEDPKNQQRLKIKVPQVFGEDILDYWTPAKGIPQGDQMGLYAIPDIGSLVWVSFEQGNPHYPIWEYGSFDTNKERHTPGKFGFYTPKGHSIELNDTEGTVTITGKAGNVVTLEKDGRISVKNGKENLKDILKDLISQTAGLDIMTATGGPGIVAPNSIQELLKIQIRILKLLS